MKVFWKVPQQQLQMEAESAAELSVIGELLHGGPMAGAAWLRVPEDRLPFARQPGDGITCLMGGASVVVGLVWDAGAAVRQRQVLNAQQALGQAVYQLLSLLPVKAEVKLAQCGPVSGGKPLVRMWPAALAIKGVLMGVPCG